MSQLTLTEDLVLLSLTKDKGKGVTPSEVAKVLKPYFDRRKEDLSSALTRLSELNMAEELARKKGQRAALWKLKDAGKSELETRFASVKFVGKYAMRNSIRFLIAVRSLNLETGVAKTMVAGDGVLAYFLAKKLEEEFDANTSVDGLASLVAAKTLSVSNGKPDFVWGQLVRQEISKQIPAMPNIAETDEKGGQLKAVEILATAIPIAEFAEQVTQAARTAKEGWFGPAKLFIHRAWEAWKGANGRDMDLPVFKGRLIDALQSNYVELSRADLPASIEASEAEAALIRHGEESYHFLVIKEAQR